jgi:hypothetical protein
MFSLAQAAASGGKDSLNDIAGNQKRPFVLLIAAAISHLRDPRNE